MAAAGNLHCCFVIQAVAPYHSDLNQILALPSSFRYHNRYNELWVDPILRDNIYQLNGMRLLLIMRDKERNVLVPVRWATIEIAQPIGAIFYFEYRLGDLIEYSRDESARNADIAQYTTVLHSHHDELPGLAGADLTRCVFLSNAGRSFSTASADDLSMWGNVVAAVGSAAIYEKVDFLKIVNLSTNDGRRQAQLVEGGFAVTSNTVYALRVFQIMPNFGDGKVIPHDIMLNTYKDHVASLRARQRAVGKYDMLTFDIKVLDLPANERTSIDLAHDPSYEPGAYASSSIYIPLVVRPRGYVVSATLLLVRLAVAGSSLLAIFQPHLLPGDPQLVRNVANVVFVISVAGTGWTLHAIWPALPWR
jgi:hypothetical protein